MSVMLSFALNGVTNNLLMDASLDETHEGEAQVTEHQVESGPNVTDYIRPLPLRLSLQVMVTNTPIYPSLSSIKSAKMPFQTGDFSGQPTTNQDIGLSPLQFNDQFDRVQDVYTTLQNARAQGVVMTIYTSLKTYTNMAIEHLTAPRNAQNSNAVVFALQLKEVREVSVQLAQTPAPRAQKKSAGNKPPKVPTESQQASNKTALQKLATTGQKAIGTLFQ